MPVAGATDDRRIRVMDLALLSIGLAVALALAGAGPGHRSLDNAFGIDWAWTA